MEVKVINKTKPVMEAIRFLMDSNLEGLRDDTIKMFRELQLKKQKDKSRTTLASSGQGRRESAGHHVITTSSSRDGHDHAAHVEWGVDHPQRKRRTKGTHALLRATHGMRKRWERGEKWIDKVKVP